jgi:hypothetical protein
VNTQEAFEKATLAVIAQGKQAINPKQRICQFRAPDGTKCWVGHLIPDDQYSSSLEGAPLDVVQKRVPALANLPIALLRDGQIAHDCASDDNFVEDFKIAIICVADRFHLSTEFLHHG